MSAIACKRHLSNPDARRVFEPAALGHATVASFVAAVAMLGAYFVALPLASGWSFTFRQFGQHGPYVVALAAVAGIPVGLLVYFRYYQGADAAIVPTAPRSDAKTLACCSTRLAAPSSVSDVGEAAPLDRGEPAGANFTLEVITEAGVEARSLRLKEAREAWGRVEDVARRIRNPKGARIRVRDAKGGIVVFTTATAVLIAARRTGARAT